VHGIPAVAHWVEHVAGVSPGASTLQTIFSGVVPALAAAFVGIVAGAVVVACLALLKKLRPGQRTAH